MEKSIYEQLYEFENEQRVHLASTVNVPIIAVTALGSAIVAMALGYPFARERHAYLFMGLLVAAALALAAAVIFVFRALIGYKYQKIPGPLALQKHEWALREYTRKEHGAGREEDAERDARSRFRAALEDAFVRATEVNGANNRNRGNFVYRANICSAIASAALTLAGVAYVVAKVERPTEIHSVRIVGDVVMTEKMPPPSQPKTPEPQSDPGRSGPPMFPPNEEYRDYTIDPPVIVEVPLHESETR